MKVLINTWSACPGRGSEQGLGWHWSLALAEHCELYIITEEEFRDEIECELERMSLSQDAGERLIASRMHFHWNPVTDRVRRMCWNQGDWRFYLHYAKWQRKSHAMALDIIKEVDIDIIHQLNMIGFREPGYMWKIKDIPLVWGPVDAREGFPVRYIEGAPLRIKGFLHLKNFITRVQLRYSTRVHRMAERAECVAANSESVKSFMKYMGKEATLINDAGCYMKEEPVRRVRDTENFDILWCGKLEYRKRLDIALHTVSTLKERENIRLHVVGGGADGEYRKLAEGLGIDDRVKFYGHLPHHDVQEIMRRSDMLLFTSVSEGTPHVVLESIANRLPVVCFDCCGHGDTIDESIGIKIPLTHKRDSVRRFGECVNKLYEDAELRERLSTGCGWKQPGLMWRIKGARMVGIYEKLKSKGGNNL